MCNKVWMYTFLSLGTNRDPDRKAYGPFIVGSRNLCIICHCNKWPITMRKFSFSRIHNPNHSLCIRFMATFSLWIICKLFIMHVHYARHYPGLLCMFIMQALCMSLCRVIMQVHYAGHYAGIMHVIMQGHYASALSRAIMHVIMQVHYACHYAGSLCMSLCRFIMHVIMQGHYASALCRFIMLGNLIFYDLGNEF